MEGKEFSVTGEIEHYIRKDVHNTHLKKLDEKNLEIFDKFLRNL